MNIILVETILVSVISLDIKITIRCTSYHIVIITAMIALIAPNIPKEKKKESRYVDVRLIKVSAFFTQTRQ